MEKKTEKELKQEKITKALEASRAISEAVSNFEFDVVIDAMTALLASVVVNLDKTGERDLFAAVTDRFTKSYIAARMSSKLEQSTAAANVKLVKKSKK